MRLRGAVSTPEFLIFNDKVNGCEFLGKREGPGGGRLFAEQHGGSGKPPEQTDVHTEDPLRLSGICLAFTMACICHGATGIAIVPPRPSHLMLKSFYLLMCVGFVRFPRSEVSTRLLAAELPPNDVSCPSSLAPPSSKGCCCLCSEK